MGFGKTVRKLREDHGLTIAQFARKVGMSPTYLAPIEREVFPPPVENKVVKIAKALDQDPDEFLALAGRVSPDLLRIIRKNPGPTARLLRAVSKMTPAKIDSLASKAGAKPRKKAARR